MQAKKFLLRLVILTLLTIVTVKSAVVFSKEPSSFPNGTKWVIVTNDDKSPIQPSNIVQSEKKLQVSPATIQIVPVVQSTTPNLVKPGKGDDTIYDQLDDYDSDVVENYDYDNQRPDDYKKPGEGTKKKVFFVRDLTLF